MDKAVAKPSLVVYGWVLDCAEEYAEEALMKLTSGSTVRLNRDYLS